mmetsp:Transcript_25306/g.34790  ORF Transcript_25306/g.34790 Transcript_25306/m.34790 type:complete len:895 (+) Transcript_25306:33-2717(+)
MGFRYRPTSQPSSSPSQQPIQQANGPKPVYINFVVLVTTLVLVLILIFSFLRIRFKKNRSKTFDVPRFSFINPAAVTIPPRTFKAFFASLIPLEFDANITWLQLFRRRLITDHSYVAIFAAAFENVNKFIGQGVPVDDKVESHDICLREHGLVCFGKTINILLVTTLAVQFLYSDYGSCASHHNCHDCEASGTSYTQAYPLCFWSNHFNTSSQNTSIITYTHKNHTSLSYKLTPMTSDYSECIATIPNSHFISILYLVILVITICILLDKILRLLASHAVCMPPLFPTIPTTPRISPMTISTSSTPYNPTEQDEKDDSIQPFDIEKSFNSTQKGVLLRGFEPGGLRDDVCDELQICQTIRATILRAARLKRMRDTADYVSAEQELRHLTTLWQSPDHPLHYNDWLPSKHVVVPSIRHPKKAPIDPGPVQKPRWTDLFRKRYKSFLFYVYDFADPTTSMDLLLHSLANERSLVVHKLIRARERADRVRNELIRAGHFHHRHHKVSIDRELDAHLLKRFLCEWFCGYIRKVAESVLFHGTLIRRARWTRRRLQAIAYFFLPLYYAGAVAYILSNGIFTIGSNYAVVGNNAATRHWVYTVWSTPTVLWFSTVLLCLAQEVLVLQGFVRVFVKQVWLPLLARPQLSSLHRVLSVRARSLLRRQKGLLLPFASRSQPHCLLQHFHPVIRAARSFPYLPAARILLSLTDYDLPLLPITKGFMVSAFSASQDNKDNPFYNGLHPWRPFDRNSPLLSDFLSFLQWNLLTALSFSLAVLAFYFKNVTAVMFYGIVCVPEWLQYLWFDMISISLLNGFCLALYYVFHSIKSPGGAVLVTWIAMMMAGGWVGFLWKNLVMDPHQLSLNEKVRLIEKERQRQVGIEKNIQKIRLMRSNVWVKRAVV